MNHSTHASIRQKAVALLLVLLLALNMLVPTGSNVVRAEATDAQTTEEKAAPTTKAEATDAQITEEKETPVTTEATDAQTTEEKAAPTTTAEQADAGDTAPVVEGKTYYIGPNGDDNENSNIDNINNDGSLEKPFKTLQKAVETLSGAPGNIYVLPAEGGKTAEMTYKGVANGIKITSTVTITSCDVFGKPVTDPSFRNTITRSTTILEAEKSTVSLWVEAANLTIENVVFDGGGKPEGIEFENGVFFVNHEKATLTMNKNAIIQNGHTNRRAGGVLVQAGEFIMNGGIIRDCTATATDVKDGQAGGGLCVKSATGVLDAKATINAGTITGCSGKSGGGVYVGGVSAFLTLGTGVINIIENNHTIDEPKKVNNVWIENGIKGSEVFVAVIDIADTTLSKDSKVGIGKAVGDEPVDVIKSTEKIESTKGFSSDDNNLYLDPDPNPETKGKIIQLSPKNMISGTITGIDKNTGVITGVIDATVELKDNAGKVVGSIVTDTNGKYKFTNVKNGEYTITAYASGYENKTRNAFTIKDDYKAVNLFMDAGDSNIRYIGPDGVDSDKTNGKTVGNAFKTLNSAATNLAFVTGDVIIYVLPDKDGSTAEMNNVDFPVYTYQNMTIKSCDANGNPVDESPNTIKRTTNTYIHLLDFNLVLDNVILDGGGEKIIGSESLVCQFSGNTTMQNGAIIQNAYTNAVGFEGVVKEDSAGGVYLNGGTFTMDNATIKDCYNISEKGGAGGLGGTKDSNVTIKSGTIKDCSTAGSTPSGGGIMTKGKLTLGTGVINISNNTNTITNTASNVYVVDPITLEGTALKTGSSVGITTDKDAFPVDVAESKGATISKDGFTSDNNTLELSEKENVLQLVPVPVTGVTLDKNKAALVVGKEETLTATIAPENARNQKVSWTSSDKAVASVDKDGKVTAHAAGTATITVTTADGSKTATCTVTVTVPVTGVKLDKENIALKVEEKAILKATVAPENATNKNVNWKSDNEAVASVDNAGKVIAKTAGTATITVTTADGSKTATCAVTVTEKPVAVTGVTLNKNETFLVVGTGEALTATIAPENATNTAVSWKSDNEAVASVDNAGKVIAKTAGTATITVTTADGGQTATCTVTVTGKQNPVVVVGKSEWTPGSKEGITFKAEGDLVDFIEVRINGKTLDKAKYTATSGSTIITIKPEYLEDLPTGNYTVDIIFKDGQGQGEFTIKAVPTPTPTPVPNPTPAPTPNPTQNETKATSVKTGVTNNPFAMMLPFALAGLAVVLLVVRKRKSN